MTRILLIGHIHADGVARLKALDNLELEQIENEQSGELADAIGRAEAVLVRTARITPAMVEAAPDLKVISRHGVGYDNVPVDALNQRKIPLAVAATANMVSVAENALAMILALSKATLRYDRGVRQGDWAIRNARASFEIFEKQLLLVGFGRISREIAKRALAFGMHVASFDPFVAAGTIEAAGVESMPDLDRAVRQADIVSLHLPKNPNTANLFDARLLSLMKSSSLLINTARGGLIDEAALFEALTRQKIAGAGLDVFETEPAPAGMKLASLDNVILSPHSAGVTRESLIRMATEAAQNIVDIMQGRSDPSVIVNWREIQ